MNTTKEERQGIREWVQPYHQWKKLMINLLDDFDELESENKRLKEVLAWYGDTNKYNFDSDLILQDGGQRARDALKGVEGIL